MVVDDVVGWVGIGIYVALAGTRLRADHTLLGERAGFGRCEGYLPWNAVQDSWQYSELGAFIAVHPTKPLLRGSASVTNLTNGVGNSTRNTPRSPLSAESTALQNTPDRSLNTSHSNSNKKERESSLGQLTQGHGLKGSPGWRLAWLQDRINVIFHLVLALASALFRFLDRHLVNLILNAPRHALIGLCAITVHLRGPHVARRYPTCLRDGDASWYGESQPETGSSSTRRWPLDSASRSHQEACPNVLNNRRPWPWSLECFWRWSGSFCPSRFFEPESFSLPLINVMQSWSYPSDSQGHAHFHRKYEVPLQEKLCE